MIIITKAWVLIRAMAKNRAEYKKAKRFSTKLTIAITLQIHIALTRFVPC